MTTRIGSLRLDRSASLGLSFLVLGVLLPTASVLWFMNEAMEVHVTAARQELAEANRRQLRFLRGAIDERLSAAVAAIDVGDDEPGGAFARLVAAGRVDAVVIAGEEGEAAYPRTLAPLTAAAADPAERVPGWLRAQALEREGRVAEAHAEYAKLAETADAPLKARAAQAAVRCLLRSGDRAAAIAALEQRIAAGDFAAGPDPRGRSIAADEQLLLLELLDPQDARHGAAAERLTATLTDYGAAPMPVEQRLFVMEAVAAERGAEPAVLFPTYEAERLALAFLGPKPELDLGTDVLEAAGVPGLWRVALADGRGVALLRTASVLALAADLLGTEPGSARFALVPPGADGPAEAVAAGPMLPGWQLAVTPLDAAAVEAFERGRRVYYVWIGGIVAAAVALTGVLVLAAYRRQIQLAALKTDLVAAVSHELKTPLSSMRVLVDTLLDDGHADERRTREYLELIARENARLSRLIELFLEFSRLERKRHRFEFAPTAPADVADAAVAAARDRLPRADRTLTVTVEPSLPAVRADRDALAAVLINLLDNAYKYSVGEPRIALRVTRDGAFVVFAVEDSGIGIHSRDHKRIFRRFYQVDRRLSREAGGVGLGLSIVELIVRAHRGSVRVRSRPGAGSTFSVRVPIAAASDLAA